MNINLSLRSNVINNAAFRTALIYAGFSVLWILFSDQILYYFVQNAHAITTAQMIKGWFFVFATSLLIYFFLQNEIRRCKDAEASLRKSEEMYRLLVETMNDSLVMVDTNGLVSYVNDQACQMLGMKNKDILGRPLSCFMDEANQLKLRHELEKRKNGGHNVYELTFTRKDRKKVPALISPKPIFDAENRFAGSFAVITDITRFKQVEQSLRESENRYRTLFDSANDAILIMQENRCIECNQKTFEMFGCTRDQVIGQPPYEFSPPDQPDGRDSTEKGLAKIATVLNGEPQVFKWRHKRMNGEEFDAEVNLCLIEIGTERFVQGIVRDISQRKMLDKKLQLMKLWIEQSVDYFFWVAEDSRILYVNQAVCRSLGYTKEEFHSMRVGDFDLEVTLEAWPAFTQNLRECGSFCFESRLRKKNGQIFPVEITANILNYDEKDHFFAYGRDISAKVHAEENRKELESQLRQAQKMEAIGTLAGGIAHDFNNILGAILGYAQLAEMDLPKNSKSLKHIDQILTASNRAKNLVRQILAFSRQSKPEMIPVDIGIIVKEALHLLRASLPANIEIQENIRSNLGTVIAEQTQVHQIMMNLCTNALHAMKNQDGHLEVSLVPVELNKTDTAAYTDIKPGRYLKLTVKDSGHGMDAATLSRIFDPYFTTKDANEGTGLGLAMVHGIVKDHGGIIKVDSEPGFGTSFHIFFPCIEETAEVKDKIKKPFSMGTGQILFLDDDKVLVDIGRKMMIKLGYKVDIRTSPYEAIEAFKADPNKYDTVITDMTMPGMSGDVFAKKILKIRPDIPIIICTGFSNMMNPEKASEAGFKALLMKPITMSDLSMCIQNVLGNN